MKNDKKTNQIIITIKELYIPIILIIKYLFYN